MTPEQEALDGVLGEIANLVRRIRRQGETHTNARDIVKLRVIRGQLMTMADLSVIDAVQKVPGT